MTLKEAISRWDKHMMQITKLLDTLSDDIQNKNFADSSDAVALICLHSQLCSARSTAMLGKNLVKTTLDEIMKSKITYSEGVKYDESKND